ncbi:MAG: hypothetical protein K2K06_01125 [Oscillospiraceae bacterium]|nr:hypothetical protein [Oscillospiraceae bacterium]
MQNSKYIAVYKDICELFHLTEPNPLPEKQIQEIQEYFGAIPKALLEYYRLCGGCRDMNASQDFLLTPDGRYGHYRMKNFDNKNYCTFYVENQCVSSWAIKKEDLIKENPPVYETLDDENWHKLCDSVSEFLISQAYMQRTFSFAYSTEEFFYLTQEQLQILAENFPHVNADSDLYMGVKFFQPYKDTLLMILKDDEEIFMGLCASENEQHFETVMNKIDKILDFEQ